jgi:hypothetical protein
MRPAWKRVAECADNRAFEPDEIRGAIIPALEQDCRREISPEFLTRLRRICRDQVESLFKGDIQPSLVELKGTAGSGMERTVLNHAIQAAAKGTTGERIAEKAMTQALTDRAARGARQVEEHYLRKSTLPRAHNVRGRIEEGINGADMNSIARRVLNGKGEKSAAKPSKRQGLDDGVKL